MVIGIITIIILAAGYLFMKNQSGNTYQSQTNPAPTTQAIAENNSNNTTVNAQETVTYTDNGFEPKSITVKAGTAVSWINKSTNPLWVASSPHPQHTDLPGFDALKAYQSGESYSYTFTKVGSWKYHNHLAPNNFGVVLVIQ